MTERRRSIRRFVAAIAVLAVAMVPIALASFEMPATADDVTHPLTFGAPVVLPQSGNTGATSKTCYNPCGEPSLIQAPDGTLYVSTPRTILVCCNTKASPVWKLDSGSTTWSQPIFPTATPSQGAALTGGDTELAVDARGTVYEGELWLGSDSMFISGDKGATWSWSPVSHDVLADREWIVYNAKDDSLYGVYDGFKGMEMIRAPLNTPAGSNAALLAPVERVMVPECPLGLAIDCPALPADEVNGTPVLDGTVSPGRPSVDQTSGTVYFPVSYQVAGKGIILASTSDGGETFQYNYVTGAGHGKLGDTGNDFPVSAVDSAGNVYVAWSENKGDGFTIYLSSSQDHGTTWSTPIPVSQGISGTAIFPNVVAGGPGRVAVSWFGTPDVGDNNTLTSSIWDVDVTQTLDALDPAPTFTTGVAQAQFHRGPICTQGTGCTGDTRKLLDFFDMQIDKATGALLIVYARDKGGLGKTGTEIAFTQQSDGCSLTQPGVYLGAGTPASPGTPPTIC